jgi:hypothetical protein
MVVVTDAGPRRERQAHVRPRVHARAPGRRVRPRHAPDRYARRGRSALARTALIEGDATVRCWPGPSENLTTEELLEIGARPVRRLRGSRLDGRSAPVPVRRGLTWASTLPATPRIPTSTSSTTPSGRRPTRRADHPHREVGSAREPRHDRDLDLAPAMGEAGRRSTRRPSARRRSERCSASTA